MRLRIFLFTLGAVLLPAHVAAFERDVHFGLTKWLALQSGYTEQQAEAIATGDQRVDSGDMQYIDLVSSYACTGKNAESAVDAARHHYPSAGRVPGPPEQRAVSAGSDAARKKAGEAVTVNEKQAGYLLYKLGDALHTLQDSWSHQGVPEVPQLFGNVIACNPDLVSAHPRTRGGWNSHKADVTAEWPADTAAMAKATYDVLQRYPAIFDAKRQPKDWASLRPALDGFIKASTKAQKKKWFVEHGIADVSFLEGITIPDGSEPFTQIWTAHKLPPLRKAESTQHRIDERLLEFFNRFFVQWVSTDDFDALANEFGGAPAPSPAARGAASASGKSDLAARLQAWRIRDHARVADIAHAAQPLTSAQRSTLASVAKDRTALARYESPKEAFIPLLDRGPEASPLLGFLIRPIAASASGNERAVATTKLRHAPYDSVVVLAERIDGRWRVQSVGAIVDH